MRIKEFSVRRYGPLPDTGRVALQNFSLLFGKNEDGKTLTIDALVKLLLRRGRSLFGNIDRVEEEPDGYLIIELENNREAKLPEAGDLTNIAALNPEECRNIFIIRNSDLSIASESEFYGDVTARLTGLRRQDILSIKKQLQELGKLTRPDSTASLRDLAGEKLKTRTTQAKKLINEISSLEDEFGEKEFGSLEETLLDSREKISEVNAEMARFEDARKRKEYEEGSKAYQHLISALKNLEELKFFTGEDMKLWSDCERDIDQWAKHVKDLKHEVTSSKEKLQREKRKLDEEELGLRILMANKQRIDNEIRPEFKTYEMKSGEVELKEKQNRFFTTATISSTILLSISIVGAILNPSPLLYALLAVFFISTGTFAALKFSFTQEKAKLAAIFKRIRLSASRFELAGDSIEKILCSVQKFDEEYSEQKLEAEGTRTEVSLLESKIRRMTEDDIATAAEKIREAEGKIQSLVQKVGVGTLQKYNKKFRLKSQHESSIQTQCEILKSHFGSQGKNMEENLPYWLEHINALKEFEDKAKGIVYDEKAVSDLKNRQASLATEEQELVDKMRTFYGQLEEIEKKANETLRLEDDYLYCSTFADMKAIDARLSNFTEGVENEKSLALQATGIFENLQAEEEEKISALFGKDSPISQYFHEISGGIYQNVEFVLNDVRKVQVKLTDGRTLDASKLSGGAYDQLYLSIRLALGEKLLKGNKGFFIMDDPFIKSDKERLQRQLDILRELSKSGWQIIYFSAKDEVRDVLKQDIENGNVDCIELPGIFPNTESGVANQRRHQPPTLR